MRYKSDPYELRTRYPGHCAACGGSLPRGALVWYYPKGGAIYGLGCPCDCGASMRADFNAAAWDEDVYSLGYGV